MTTYYSKNPKFYVSVDCIIFGFNEGELNLLHSKRPQTSDGRHQQRCGRVVEEARLESVYTPKGYRGFESPSLRNSSE